MSYLEELLPEFRKGAKIRIKDWESDRYIYLKDDDIFNEVGLIFDLSVYDIKTDKWELYQEPEPDWDYIIENKCLCWFWDVVEEAKIIGILCKINNDGRNKFVRNFEGARLVYKYCRPVRRDEVTFYEDRKQ